MIHRLLSAIPDAAVHASAALGDALLSLSVQTVAAWCYGLVTRGG